MKKKLFLVTILIAILIIISGIGTIVLSKYNFSLDNMFSINAEKPVARMIINNNLHITNYQKVEPVYFSVCNYNEQENTSNISFEYYITLKLSQKNAPLNYKLYKINGDKEELITIDVSNNSVKTINPVILESSEREHKYKLEVTYDFDSEIKLDEDIAMSFLLNVNQVIM